MRVASFTVLVACLPAIAAEPMEIPLWEKGPPGL